MELDLFIESIRNSVKKMNMDIEKLYSNRINNKRQVLEHLNREVMMLEENIKYINQSNKLSVKEIPTTYPRIYANQVQPTVNTTRVFTLEELAQYNGKNGNPAYVAVNGVVYDVTNIPAWTSATHFGISAGNDLTIEFESCHGATKILEKLPVVGNLS
jgi:predicted heme/steroid binding protein